MFYIETFPRPIKETKIEKHLPYGILQHGKDGNLQSIRPVGIQILLLQYEIISKKSTVCTPYHLTVDRNIGYCIDAIEVKDPWSALVFLTYLSRIHTYMIVRIHRYVGMYVHGYIDTYINI